MNELLRNGAKQLIHQAVEAELSEYLSQHQCITDDGRVVLLRNGYLPKRGTLTGIVQSVSASPRYVRKTVRRLLSVLHWYRPTSEKPDPWKQHYLGCT